MPTERLIGIDFGTSTSVIRVKRYRDGRPVDDRLTTAAVTFNMGSTMLPTLVRRIGDALYYGYDAESELKNSVLHRNFKVSIESENPAERLEARELTEAFFNYMAEVYRGQSDGGHLGEFSDTEKTLISYPVKWTTETKQFMLETARKAGFPCVEGMDEAQAAIHAALVQNEAAISGSGYLYADQPINIMLIDMGAGTTDIVISRYTVGKSVTNEVLCTWPKGGDILFGGREVDELLSSYIWERLPAEVSNRIMRALGIDAFKSWKDMMVSPALAQNETVTQFSALETLLSMMDVSADYDLGRADFERIAAPYLKKFPQLVKDSLRAAGLAGKDIDLVILAGGHSRWYFVKEMLTETMGWFGGCGLEKIKADPRRIISVTLPQETVALGLVYAPLTYQAKAAPPPAKPVMQVSSAYPMQENMLVTGVLLCDSIQQVKAVQWDHNGIKQRARIIDIRKNGASVNQANRQDMVSLLLSDVPHGSIESGVMLRIQTGDVLPGSSDLPGPLSAVDAGYAHTTGLKKDGTVVAAGKMGRDTDLAQWKNIVQISDGGFHVVGLRNDGTVVAAGKNAQSQCAVLDWAQITAVSAGLDHTVGLKEDGTVVATGLNTYGRCSVQSWENITAVSAGDKHTVGLQSNGKVVAVGCKNDGRCNVSLWEHMVAISAGGLHTVGLRDDGTVRSVGSEEFKLCNTAGWTNITAISAGGRHTLGLKKDGTVVAVGNNQFGQCNTREWRDIVAISAGENHSIGVRRDGTLLVIGGYLDDECNVEHFGMPVLKTVESCQKKPDHNSGGGSSTNNSSTNNSSTNNSSTSGSSSNDSCDCCDCCDCCGSCYVATAVYGSYDCPEVWTLRRYRDDVLASTWYGRTFIRTYYAISPTIVKHFGHTKWFNRIWRKRLDKMVHNLREAGVESTPYADKDIQTLLYGKKS